MIVTTPQDVSLIDARRGMEMFRQVRVPVLGIVENMSYFIGEDGKRYELFGHGGGQKLAAEMHVPFLGEIPIDPRVAECGDAGDPIVHKYPDSPAAKAYLALATNLPADWPKGPSPRNCRVCNWGAAGTSHGQETDQVALQRRIPASRWCRSWIASLKEKTGRTLEQWLDHHQKGRALTTRRPAGSWLKEQSRLWHQPRLSGWRNGHSARDLGLADDDPEAIPGASAALRRSDVFRPQGRPAAAL